MSSLSILGLGLLGGALAERLSLAGWRVRTFDPDLAARTRSSHLQLEWLESEAAAVADAATVLVCFPNSTISNAVVPGLFKAMAPGGIVIDCTTGDPEEMAELAAIARRSGHHYLDATVGGSSSQARAGEALIMFGGDDAAVALGLPVIQAISKRAIHAGAAGYGARAKLVMNLALGLNRAALAEALHLGRALGLTGPLILDVLRSGPAYARVLDSKADRMIQENFVPEARLSQHRKDVNLMLAAAQRFGIELPLTQTHDAILAKAEAAGFGDSDNSAVIKGYPPPC